MNTSKDLKNKYSFSNVTVQNWDVLIDDNPTGNLTDNGYERFFSILTSCLYGPDHGQEEWDRMADMHKRLEETAISLNTCSCNNWRIRADELIPQKLPTHFP